MIGSQARVVGSSDSQDAGSVTPFFPGEMLVKKLGWQVLSPGTLSIARARFHGLILSACRIGVY